MPPNTFPIPYQISYILFPTITIIGNGFIVYVTVRSRSLRSPCNLLIGLLSLADVVQSFGNYIFTITYNFIEGHEIRHSLCLHLQLTPVFASCLSLVLLLNIAMDRLFSLMSFYDKLVAYYRKHYMTAHIIPGIVYGTVINVLVLVYRTPDEYILCSPAIIFQGPSYDVLIMSIVIVCVLVILCYLVLMFFLFKTRTSSVNMKNIYRSLVIITLAVIFGYFGAAIVVIISDALRIKVERFHLNLFSSILASFSTSITFFVYYTISSEYREAFDRYLGFGRLRKVVSRNRTDVTITNVMVSVIGSSKREVGARGNA